MRQHLTIIVVLHVLLGAFGVFTGLAILTASVAAGALVGTSASGLAGLLVGTTGTVIAAVVLALAIAGLAFAWGVHRRAAWARPLGIVLGVLNLFHFPFGTLVGAYTLWVMLQPETTTLLSGDRAMAG